MLTLQSAPVYYLPTTKCGSTYLKNLFYYLDHAEEHSAGIDIHSNAADLLRAHKGDEDIIRQSPYGFAVLRDPVDRFLSLYFDKIYGDGPNNFADVREYLANGIGLDLTTNLTADTHRQNCYRFIDWLALNLAFETVQPVNYHWRRQSSRLQRVKALDLKHLTLDGLDWQLPMLLGDIIPNVRAAMQVVTADNRTIKPFQRSEILEATLLRKIETVYAEDKTLYDHASNDWQPWRKNLPEITPNDTLRCYTATNLPINCVVTLKSGATYLRNVLYLLEHRHPYGEPLKIDSEGASTKGSLTRSKLAQQVSFFVVRDPVSRFFSLYFDKIQGKSEHTFTWVTARLVKHRGFVVGDDLTVAQHQHNIGALLGYLELRFRDETPAKQNPHWQPQVSVARKAICFGLQPLLLENLDEQLLQIADGRITDLEAAIKATPRQNTSEKPFTLNELLTPEIAARISALYGEDQALYERVKAGWRYEGRPPIL